MGDIIVSIIIPVYNQELYIADCLESVVNQTYSRLEIIIVDDGSTDNSYQIIKSYLDDARIKYVKKKNEGVSVARNYGINLSTGKYILFIDSDDIIEKNYIEMLVRHVYDNPSIDMVVCGIKSFNIDGVISEVSFFDGINIPKDVYIKKYSENNIHIVFGGPYCKLIRAEILKQNEIIFEPYEYLGEDFIFNTNLIYYIKNIEYEKNIFYKYRVDNKGSLSKSSKPSDYFINRYFLMYDKYLKLKEDHKFIDSCGDDLFLVKIIKMVCVNIAEDENLETIEKKKQMMTEFYSRIRENCYTINNLYNLSLKDRLIYRLFYKKCFDIIILMVKLASIRVKGRKLFFKI